MKFLKNKCDCGNDELALSLFFAEDYNFNTMNEKSMMMRCVGCGSLFPEMFPDSNLLSKAYSCYYTKNKTRNGFRKIVRKFIDATRSSHVLRNLPGDARVVLDYGCGSGEYLGMLLEKGCRATLFGTDITKPNFGVVNKFNWLSLDEFSKIRQQYDWITLSHVIEHLPEAESVLHQLRTSCRNDGGVWLSTPNSDSLLIKIFHEYARDIDFPRHRQIYSRIGLVRKLSDCGFEVRSIPSPRVDVLLNYVSCARNLLRANNLSAIRKLRILGVGMLYSLLHILKPSAWRMADAPELVVVAKPQW
jgi:SAM-dependent methyltransferase